MVKVPSVLCCEIGRLPAGVRYLNCERTDIENVAFLELALIRNSMTDDFVDRTIAY